MPHNTETTRPPKYTAADLWHLAHSRCFNCGSRVDLDPVQGDTRCQVCDQTMPGREIVEVLA